VLIDEYKKMMLSIHKENTQPIKQAIFKKWGFKNASKQIEKAIFVIIAKKQTSKKQEKRQVNCHRSIKAR
jgi:isocitrate dehydrogenase